MGITTKAGSSQTFDFFSTIGALSPIDKVESASSFSVVDQCLAFRVGDAINFISEDCCFANLNSTIISALDSPDKTTYELKDKIFTKKIDASLTQQVYVLKPANLNGFFFKVEICPKPQIPKVLGTFSAKTNNYHFELESKTPIPAITAGSKILLNNQEYSVVGSPHILSAATKLEQCYKYLVPTASPMKFDSNSEALAILAPSASQWEAFTYCQKVDGTNPRLFLSNNLLSRIPAGETATIKISLTWLTCKNPSWAQTITCFEISPTNCCKID